MSRVLPKVLAYGGIAGLVVALHHFRVNVHLPAGIHETAGAVIALLLAFRTNTAYNRFWEGRSLWGAIVNASRNLAQIVDHHVEGDATENRAFDTWIVVFAWVTRRRLRSQSSWPEVRRLLEPGDFDAIEKSGHPSLFAAHRLSDSLARWSHQGRVEPIMAASAQETIGKLVDSLGGCEKIAKTPSPFGHVVLMERFITLYLATLPFMILSKIESVSPFVTPIATMLIAYPIVYIDALAAVLDNPFGHDPSHLPLTRICLTIESDLLGTSPPPDSVFASG